ncbi:3-deoxy-manno-octulosonate cytidylyltransferase [Flavobacteriales bacterium]|nr:3-deoxy-manno-octulosonate cytidylyltransferase [Flavobacteriales bacterium]
MKILGIIPARFASTRLQGKPLKDICGKTMIQRVYEQAIQALEHVYIATDDSRIEAEVNSFGGNVIMTSTEHTTGTNRCVEAYNIVQKELKIDFDAIINIQGDEPLLEPEILISLANCFNDSSTEMATLIRPVHDKKELLSTSDIWVVIDKNDNALYFSREIIPHFRGAHKDDWIEHHAYYKHIGMYGFTPKAIKQFASMNQTNLEKAESLEQLRWLENGGKIKVAHTAHHALSVDTQEDLDEVIEIIQKRGIKFD